MYRWSSNLNREYRVYKDACDELKPHPGDEAMMLDSALSQLWQALKAGRERAETRGEAWDRSLAGLRPEQATRPEIVGG